MLRSLGPAGPRSANLFPDPREPGPAGRSGKSNK